MKSGIYKILNLVNSKFYIGSAIDFKIRFYKHKYELLKKSHRNSHLLRAWDKYGETNFEFIIIEYIENATKEKLLEREQFYLDTLKPEYNLNPTAGSALGTKHSEKTKSQMRKPKPQGFAEQVSIRMKNYKCSEETKEILRQKAILRGSPSEEVRLKLSLNSRFRNKDKFPHPEGYKCKCPECKEKKRLHRLNWERARPKRDRRKIKSEIENQHRCL